LTVLWQPQRAQKNKVEATSDSVKEKVGKVTDAANTGVNAVKGVVGKVVK
jgi:uncharacterized protein YjbJ (UPF0337 family)